jgi:hypothetical protein
MNAEAIISPQLESATKQQRDDALTDLFVGLTHAITENGCRVDLDDPLNIMVTK